MEDEDDYLDDASCQHLVADSTDDMPERCGHFTSLGPSNKSGQNPRLYKGKLFTFLKVRPEGFLFGLLVSVLLFNYIFIVAPLKIRIIVLAHVHAQPRLEFSDCN